MRIKYIGRIGRDVFSIFMLLRAGRLKKWREGKGRLFYPPKDNAFVRHAVWRFLPTILHFVAKVDEVETVGLERLKAIGGQRAVLTPNHPTHTDSFLMFEVSRQLGEPFRYLASRETFAIPLMGMLAQLCGAYSIQRGAVDRAAVKTTRDTLSSGSHKLVMFPEGLTYGHNDRLMPFHQGVVRFGFWALEDMRKAGVDEPLFYVPVSLRYLYMRSMSGEIESALARLERHLSLPAAPGGHRLDRLRTIGVSVVATYEHAYGVKSALGEGLDVRIQRMKEVWIARAMHSLGLENKLDVPLGDRMRVVINALDHIQAAGPDSTGFQRKVLRKRFAEAQSIYHDMGRVSLFLATEAGYVLEDPSDERFLEVIRQIEEEVFGHSPIRGPRRAVVQIGDPIDAREFLSEGGAQALTGRLESEVAALLGRR